MFICQILLFVFNQNMTYHKKVIFEHASIIQKKRSFSHVKQKKGHFSSHGNFLNILAYMLKYYCLTIYFSYILYVFMLVTTVTHPCICHTHIQYYTHIITHRYIYIFHGFNSSKFVIYVSMNYCN
jgi:hypothetical protein